MRGLDDYYGDDSDAFAGVEELNDRIAELEAENERLRERLTDRDRQIGAVREMHSVVRFGVCQSCGQVGPCDTLAVINGIGDA